MTGTVSLGVLGDVHLAAEPHPRAAWHNAYDFHGLPARIDAAVTAFEQAGVDAICLIGDLTHDGSLDALAPLADRLAGVTVPVLVASGNHDPGCSALVRALPHARPVAPEGELLGEWRLAGVQIEAGQLFGARLHGLPPVDEWGEDPLVLLSHFPVMSLASPLALRGMPYPGDVLERDLLADMLARREAPAVVLSGHIHARASAREGAILQIVQGALVEAPYECSVIELGDGRVMRRSVELAGPSPDGCPPVLVTSPDTYALVDGVWRPALPTSFSHGHGLAQRA